MRNNTYWNAAVMVSEGELRDAIDNLTDYLDFEARNRILTALIDEPKLFFLFGVDNHNQMKYCYDLFNYCVLMDQIVNNPI